MTTTNDEYIKAVLTAFSYWHSHWLVLDAIRWMGFCSLSVAVHQWNAMHHCQCKPKLCPSSTDIGGSSRFRGFCVRWFCLWVHTSVSVVFGVVSSAVATKGGSHYHTTPFNSHCLLAKETQCCGKLQKIYCLQNFVEEEKHALKSTIWNLTRGRRRERNI